MIFASRLSTSDALHAADLVYDAASWNIGRYQTARVNRLHS